MYMYTYNYYYYYYYYCYYYLCGRRAEAPQEHRCLTSLCPNNYVVIHIGKTDSIHHHHHLKGNF